MKTLHIIPCSESGKTHAYEIDIDVITSAASGQAVYKLREVPLERRERADFLIIDEFPEQVHEHHA